MVLNDPTKVAMILTNDDPHKKKYDSGRRFGGIFLAERYELDCELRREIQDLRELYCWSSRTFSVEFLSLN
jgi:hypothetical protein